jgi:Flp pilus assembly protein TadG
MWSWLGGRGIRGERGQSLVEFALVLPVLLFIFMGIFDFGRVMFLYSQLSNGAREAARYGAVTGLNPMAPQYLDCNGIRNAVTSRFGLPQTVTVTIQYDNGQSIIFTNCDSSRSPDAIVSGNRIRVTVSSQVRFVTPMISAIMPARTLSFTAARTILKNGTFVPYN